MGARILIVEDNPPNLDLMGYLLGAFGHATIPAPDAATALSAARADRPDLVLLDLQLPGSSGYEVLVSMRSIVGFASVPIVAVTAFAMVGDRENVLAAGFDGYIAKPITPESFVGQVEAFLPPEKAGRRKPVASASAAPPSPAVDKRERALILVVDDSPTNLELSRSVLEPFGYEVLTQSNVRNGLDEARRRKPDLLLTDVHLPDGTGLDLLEAARRDPILADVPVGIISSSGPSPDVERLATKLGAVVFIRRPIEPETLLASIRACLVTRAG